MYICVGTKEIGMEGKEEERKEGKERKGRKVVESCRKFLGN